MLASGGSASGASPPDRWRATWTLAAAIVALATAVVTTWPLATALPDAVPTWQWHCLGKGCEDEFLCVWIVTALGKRLLTAPMALFEGGILLPFRHTLAYSETMLSAVAATAPVTWLTGNHVLAYDLYYLAIPALSTFGTFLLVREITGDARAALLAGLLFGLAGEQWLHRGHLAKLSVQWVPFVCWTWLRFLDRPTRGRGIALAGAALANLHAGIYQGLLLPILLAPWALVLLVGGSWPPSRWATSLGVLGLVHVVGLLAYWPFAIVRDELQLVTSGVAAVPNAWHWYVGPFLDPLGWLRALGASGRTIDTMTPLPALALAAALVAARLRPAVVPAPDAQLVHLAATVAFALTTVLVTLHPDHLGPLGRLLDAAFTLPGLDGLRGRSRLVTLVTFGGAVAFGIAVASLHRRIRRPRGRWLLAGALGTLIVVDARTLREPLPLSWLPRREDLPPALQELGRTNPTGGILHLPDWPWSRDTLYMMWALHHGRPIMNGYTAVMPRFGPLIRALPRPEAFGALADAGITDVLIHRSGMTGTALKGVLERVDAAHDLPTVPFGDDLVIRVDRVQSIDPGLAGRPLPRDGWGFGGSDPNPERAADGDLRTHWVARTDRRPTVLRIDLGAPRAVTGVRLALGPHFREFPHAWELWGSLDGGAFQRLGGANPTLPPFRSYRSDHRAVVLDLPVPEVAARFLELRVPPQNQFAVFDTHNDGRWGVHELDVFAR